MAGKLTAEQKAEIIARRLNGENATAIGQSYGVSLSVICAITKNVTPPEGGWKRNRRSQLSDKHKKEIPSLIATMSYAEIALKYGVSHDAVAHFIRTIRPSDGWGPRPKPLTNKLSNEAIADVIRRREAGETLESIALYYKVSAPAIHKIVKHIKLGYRVRKKKLSGDQIKDAISRRINGESLQSIALLYGVTAPCIFKVTKQAKPPEGWKRKRTPLNLNSAG